MNITTLTQVVCEIRSQALTAVCIATLGVTRVTPCSLPGGYRLLEGHAASIFRVEIRHRRWRQRVLTKRLCLMNSYTISESRKHRYCWMAQQHLVGQGLLIIEASRSHSDTQNSVGPLWTSDQPDLETSDNTQYSQQTNIHAPPPPPEGFEPAIPASQRPQAHILDRKTTAIGKGWTCSI